MAAAGSFNFADYTTIPCDGQCRQRQLFPCRQCTIRKRAKGDRRCLKHTIEKALKAGDYAYFGTSKPGIDLQPSDVKYINVQFQKVIRKQGWHIFWSVEITPSNHARLHWHYTIISPKPIAAGVVNSMFAATIPSAGRCCSTQLKPIESAKAAAKYLTGDTKGKTDQPMFNRKPGFKKSGSTVNFFGEPKATLNKRLLEQAKAYFEALGVTYTLRRICQDGFILEHPTWDHYANVGQERYAQLTKGDMQNGYILDNGPSPDRY